MGNRGDLSNEQWERIEFIQAGQLQNIKEKFGGDDFSVRHGSVIYDFERTFAPTKAYDLEYSGYDESERTRRSLIKYCKNNILCESPDWKPEHEFRWLIFNQTDSETKVSIEDALKAVVVGIDYQCHFPSLKALCKQLQIPLGKMNWPTY